MYKSYHEDAADGDLYLAVIGDGAELPTSFEITRVEVDGPFLWPTWSADGTRVYYSRRLAEGTSGLFELEIASGARNRLLSEEVLVGALTPSVDRSGRWLLFNNSVSRRAVQSALAPGLYLLDRLSSNKKKNRPLPAQMPTLAERRAQGHLDPKTYYTTGPGAPPSAEDPA